MSRYSKYLKFFLLVVFAGMSGCAELDELRTLNRRQAITIRDQADELAHYRQQLSSLSDTLKSKQEEMEKLRKLAASIGEGVSVRDTVEGPVILFPEKILFDSGMATIKPNGKIALEKIARFLDENPSNSIRIDGHTDSDPIVRTKHLWDSNHHLASARALSVFHFLTKNEKIAETRIHVAGFGANRSIVPNDTDVGKRQNRRVEFLILTSVGSLMPKGTSFSYEEEK
ncbi:MAG: flagellar motor protein MotB [Candidatus Brocadiaceae bacterium]|nr:flagellar motor protein MotB [Candidatus Brocadiaceae bacterium]